MALKRKNKPTAEFSMASMTDIVFLLLLFFMIMSTIVTPNAIRVLLPQSSPQVAEKPLTRVIIDKDLNYFVSEGQTQDVQVTFEQIEPYLQQVTAQTPEMYIALYADEVVPYREIVRILNIANENNFKLVLATRPLN
ncbi:MAG: biopolymer transporter ExbD [Prevotellaceae bacterium]|jgi:biopolymer transport protein ExbD|nr:biopolymer transporter ExbD [Prevotellaceae bacterium]